MNTSTPLNDLCCVKYVRLRRYCHCCGSLLENMLTPTVEHNIPADQRQEPVRRRPDLGTFFSTLDLVDTSGSRQPQNSNALPLPQDVSAAFRTLANAFEMMRTGGATQDDGNSELLGNLVQSLMDSAEHPPTEVEVRHCKFGHKQEHRCADAQTGCIGRVHCAVRTDTKKAAGAKARSELSNLRQSVPRRYVWRCTCEMLANADESQTRTHSSCDCRATRTISSIWRYVLTTL